ncbi:hypothetical protein NX059_003472 [Plenodomus lindquistii]|nr:hypothetical protein NX059_003472 [Plenodomus lindquistii]
MSLSTEYWKTHRKNITKIVSTNTSISVFGRIQEVEAAHFLLNLLASPDDLFDHIRKEAGGVILKITYGYNIQAHGRDPFVDLAQETMTQFADATVPGRWLVDVLPFLRHVPEWCPGGGYKKIARRYAATLNKCANQPYEFVKYQMRENRNKPSFLSQCIADIGADAESEFVHKWAALALYTGGADTTVSAIMTFFLAMMVFPDVQRKAQEEIDRVIGISRLPRNTDRERLPYLAAVMKETHRWHQVVPMCLPHASVEEDVCRGYRIPKGAVILPNIWFVRWPVKIYRYTETTRWFTHDPEVYPDPMAFRPERHLDTPDHKAETDPRNFVFGYGRRICPGRFVADDALFVTISQTLAVFNVQKPTDANGEVVEPEVKFEPGAISHPLPYKAVIVPRSEEHKALIIETEKLYPWEKSDAKELEGIV